jgi:hypothetical protein
MVPNVMSLGVARERSERDHLRVMIHDYAHGSAGEATELLQAAPRSNLLQH